MNSDFIDAALIEIGSQSPRTLYDRYIASRKCRKLVPASKGTLSQLLMNIDTIGPQLCQLFKETIIKVLEEHQARSKPTISIDRKGRLTCSKPRVSKKRSKRYPSRNDDTSRRSNEDFEHLETWIECTRCKKWRFVADIYDISDVSRKWHCGLQTKWKADSASLGNGNPCDEEEDVAGKERFHAQPQVYSEFTAGSIVWAKIRGYPWWPAIVNLDQNGCYAYYDPVTYKVTHYEVVFLDPHVMTVKRLPTFCIRKYTSSELVDEGLRRSPYWQQIEKAISEAEDALKLPVQVRLNVYGYKQPKEPRGSPKADQSLRQNYTVGIRKQKNGKCKISRRGRPRKKKNCQELVPKRLRPLFPKNYVIQENEEAERSTTVKKFSQMKTSAILTEESPSFLYPPSPATLQSTKCNLAGKFQESICNGKFADQPLQVGSPSRILSSSDSRCFAISLPQERSSDTTFFPSLCDDITFSWEEINSEKCLTPGCVALSLSQETVSENLDTQISLIMDADENESVPGICYFSPNHINRNYEGNAECAAEFSQEAPLEDSTFISDGLNNSMRVDAIANLDESCQITDCIPSNELDIIIHDISECANPGNLIPEFSSDHISAVLPEETPGEIQPVENIETCSILGFLKQSIRARLDERAHLIRKISDVITNLPFRLQLKPL